MRQGVAYVYSGADPTGDTVFEAWGTPYTEGMGYAVDLLEDIDGDGVGEVLVMGEFSPDHLEEDENRQIYVQLGPVSGEITRSHAADRTFTILGEKPQHPSGVGDLDGDGLSDLVVAALLNEDGGEDAGAHYIVYGADLAEWGDEVDLPDEIDPILGQEDDIESVGAFGPRGAGDLDGDGLGDLVVTSGTGYVILGDTLAVGLASTADADVLVEPSPPPYHGYSGTYSWGARGDVDGDGLDDAAFSGYDDGVYLFFASTLLADSTVRVVDGDVLFEDFSYTGIQGVGDMDGDGTTDLTGSWATNQYIFSGASVPSSGTVTRDDATASLLDVEAELVGLHAVGDVSGDGQADLLLYPNYVYLILGW